MRRVLGIALAVLAGAAPARAADAPDLTLELPAAPYAGQVAPVYLDPYEQPGRLLYRFDAVISNRGGTLDLFRDNGRVMQAVWRNGTPDTAPDPNVAPSGPNVTISDRSPTGARFAYVFERTHNHWHFFSAARYALDVPGEAAREGKIGFCMFDSFGAATYFQPWDTGSGSQTWCGFDHPNGSFVRMGLSPGAADRYAAPREFQWVDVTGLTPGEYRLRGTVNPAGELVESDTGNNAIEQTRVVPGALARDAAAQQSGQAVSVALNGTVMAPEVPVRTAATCDPLPDTAECYRWPDPTALRFDIVRAPEHGSARVTGATATYEPAPGYAGADSFDYVVTDDRGLTSPPARVTIAAQSAPASATQPATPPAARKTSRIVLSATPSHSGRRYSVVLRLSVKARISATVRCGSRTIIKRTRTLARGRTRLALATLPRTGRCSVQLTARTSTRRERLTVRLRGPKPARTAALLCRLT